MTGVLARLLLVAALVGTSCGAGDGTPNGEPAGSDNAPASKPGLRIETAGAVPVVDLRSGPELPTTVTDATGATVDVSDVDRIVTLWSGLAEAVVALGLGDDVVGRDVSTTIHELSDVPLVTRSHDVSAEAVLSVGPTVVLADTETGPPEALDMIRSAGVPVVVFERTTRVDEIAAHLREVAGALGVREAGVEAADAVLERLSDALDQGVATVENPQDRPSVAFLYLRGSAGVYLLGGRGSGADSLIAAAGGTDVGSKMGLESFTPLTSEALVAAAPDVILTMAGGLDSVGGLEGLADLPGVAQTPAGRNGRIISAEDGELFAFGPRTPHTISALSKYLGTGPA